MLKIKAANKKMLIPGGELYDTLFTLSVPENIRERMKEKLETPISLGKDTVTEIIDMDLYEDFYTNLRKILGVKEHPDYSLLEIGYNVKNGLYDVAIRSIDQVDLERIKWFVPDYFSRIQKIVTCESTHSRGFHAA